jgi:hypothetical protein
MAAALAGWAISISIATQASHAQAPRILPCGARRMGGR